MSRTATLTARRLSDERWVLLAGDDVPLGDQQKAFILFRGVPNDSYSVVKYQESDGEAEYQHLLTSKADKAYRDRIAADNKSAQDHAEVEEKARKVASKKAEDFAQKQHVAEIDRINKMLEDQKKAQQKAKDIATRKPDEPEEDVPWRNLVERDADGLRLDGPTLEEFMAHGYLASNYPPNGYAAKPSPIKSDAPAGAQPAAAPGADQTGADAGAAEGSAKGT